MMDGSRIDQAVQRGREAALEELRAFCAQPSVSAQDTGMKEMAALVMEALRRRGFTTRPAQTRRHPAILAECRGRSSRSVLFYNHYAGRPRGPRARGASPPFTPSLRDGKLFARGVMDDKGHLACRLAAIDAVRDAQGGLPCTVKFLVEGEEEIASPNLEQIVLQNRDALAADVCVWEFGEVDEEGVSNQFLGFRGLLYVELSLQELSQDCHSGIWGTLLPNAAWRLNWALSTLKERDERIRIPGFYDAVVPPSHQDMKLMEKLPLIPLSQAMGARRFLAGHPSPAEFHRRAVMSPSCTICGLTAGYQGPGQKTIVPARASAKVDFRLVPNQTPDEILSKLKAHLEAEGFGDIEVTCFGRLNPSRTPVDHPLVRMAVESAREVYGQPQRVFPMSGGSGPAHLFTGHLGMPVLTTGVGYLGSNIHSPNENIRLTDFYNGIRHTARMLAAMGEG